MFQFLSKKKKKNNSILKNEDKALEEFLLAQAAFNNAVYEHLTSLILRVKKLEDSRD